MTENQLLALTRQYGSMDEALKNMPQAELRLNDNSVYDKKGPSSPSVASLTVRRVR